MKIWHTAALPPSRLNGVSATIWLLAAEQAHLGHDVSVLMDEPADDEARALAAEAKFKLFDWKNGLWNYDPASLMAALESPPAIVHMHSVFIPRQATMCRELWRRKIPYIVTPHGGLAPVIQTRSRLRKFVYSLLIERRRCRRAAMLTAAPGEAAGLLAFTRRPMQPVAIMPVPVNARVLGDGKWRGNVAARKFVFLGRFDVHVKGLDLLVEVARLMPDATFELYGSIDAKTESRLRALQQNCPANVRFSRPIFGSEKGKVLSEASMYLQLSRSESFGIALAEAMYLGVPCAIAEGMNMAGLFRERNLGLLVPYDPPAIAARLTDALSSVETLKKWSERAGKYAGATYEPRVAAQSYVKLYEMVCAPRSRTTEKPLAVKELKDVHTTSAA